MDAHSGYARFSCRGGVSMIKFEKQEVWGFDHAIRGMRNPLNSWDRIDSSFAPDINVGSNDLDLMTRLINGGQPHRKFLRQIMVAVDITAPLYWWKEFDTYKVGTTANSCSTMHKIHAKEFVIDDFSHDHLTEFGMDHLCDTIWVLNNMRNSFLDSKDKAHWYDMIQTLPTSYNQKRTVTMNYENLLNMLEYRRGHKLDEWREFCEWIKTLPYGQLLWDALT